MDIDTWLVRGAMTAVDGSTGTPRRTARTADQLADEVLP